MNIEEIIANITEEVVSRLTTTSNSSAQIGNSTPGYYPVPSNIAKNIEHCLLNPQAKIDEVRKACAQVREYELNSICILPWYASYAADLLKGSDTEISVIVGLPMGKSSTAAKCAEAREATRNGATVLDIAVNVESIKAGDMQKARNDIEQTMTMTFYGDPRVRLILESDVYSREEKKMVCELARICKANGIYITNNIPNKKACADDVKLVRSLLDKEMEIKVSGAVSEYSHAKELIAAGANLIATSASISILNKQ